MTYRATRSFTFEYELERDEETHYIEVVYAASEDEVWLEEVRGADTTPEEDAAILAYAKDRVDEDITDDDAAYGDYLYDLRRDQED